MTAFIDDHLISSAHREAVEALVEAGVLTGFEDLTFRPGEYPNRQQLASIIYRAMKVLGWTPPELEEPDPDPQPEPGPDPEPEPEPEPEPGGGFLVASAERLASRPTTGPAWQAIVTASARNLAPQLNSQDGYEAADMVAAGLHAARSDETWTRLATALDRVTGTVPTGGNAVLATGRKLAGIVIAADLIGYRDAVFETWLDDLVRQRLGSHGRWTSIIQCSEDSANNWGTFALSARIAVARYLDDRDDLARAVQVFRGFLGDRSAYAGFRPTSSFRPSWAANDPWLPVNHAPGDPRDGALVEDASRAGDYPALHANYVGEAAQGVVLSALLLDRAGYDVAAWSDQALRRLLDWLVRNGVPASWHHINRWTIPALQHLVGGEHDGALVGSGRSFGWTDWLYG